MLESRVQLANGVFKDDIDGPVIAITVKNTSHDPLSSFSIFPIRVTQVLLNYAHTNNFVTVVDKLVQQPLQSIIGVGMLVNSNHKAP
jgi:hypothetical protein